MNPVESSSVSETNILDRSLKKDKADVTHVLNLSPFKITYYLFIIVACLLAAHIAVISFEGSSSISDDLYRRLDHFFNFNNEVNVPTYFSYSILFLASILLFIIYKLTHVKSKDRKYWLLLSFIFLFISLDEAIQIHERINSITRQFIKNDLSGLLYWAWVIPYTLLFAILGVYFLKFIFRLPVRTRNIFLIAGFIFITGAVGIEILEGYFIKLDLISNTRSNIVYALTITTQELLEMCSIIIFINELLRYIVSNYTVISFGKPS